MGNSISKIVNDEEDYDFLCKKYNEEWKSLYSVHHRWLEDKNSNKTSLTFEEYNKKEQQKEAKFAIKDKKEQISRLQKEIEYLEKLV